MADIFKPKRGSHNVIARINPLLEEGEVVFEYPESGNRGLGLIKMGDGVHRYNDLPVFVVTITDYIPIEEKGAPNGIAPLNPAGKVDADYLPSYVDDVLEYPHREDFPVPGEKGKIYVDTSTEWNNIYRWSGTVYICIGTSVKYELKQNKNVIRLEGSDSSVNRVDVTQIYEYDGIEDFPYPGKSGCIYVATSAIYNNLYRWDDTDRRYVGCANMNSYALIKNGPTITLMSSDGTDSSISSEILEYNSVSQFPAQGILNTLYIDISTTENNTYRWTGSEYVHITTSVKYLIAKDENYLKLTGSDGSEIDLQNDVLFYETKAQFPTEDPEDPSTTISRFKFFVDYSTNSIYRWDGTQYVLINGDTTYTLSRADNKITLKTTVAGVDSTTSIPTSVYIWNDGTHYRPTTGQVGILYINDGKPLDNNLWKWTGTNYAVVAGDTRYSIIKDTTDHLLGLRAYRPDDSTTDIWHIDTSVQLFDSTSSFKPYAYKDIIYVDKSKDRNNLYVADSSSHFTLVGGDTQYDLTSDNKDIKLVSSEGSTDTIPKSVSYYNSTSAFPTTGSINIIYVDKNNVRNNLYLWDTSKSKYEVISGNDNYSLDKNTLNQLRLL